MERLIFFALEPPPPGTWETIRVLLWVILAIGAVIGVLVGIQKLRSTDEPKRRLLPNPLVTKAADEFLTVAAFQEQRERRTAEMKAMETRIEKRIDEHEKIVRVRFHELSGQINGVALGAKENSELATEQFQNIEGRLGEVKSDIKHITQQQSVNSDKLDRLTDTLPEKIAVAIDRNNRRRR